MVQPPNEELSALAQELLQAHRESHGPQEGHEDRVWQRLHHSAFVAPAALLVDPVSQAAGAGQAQAAAGSAMAKGGLVGTGAKVGASAGAAKAGLLSTVGAKVVLAAGLTAGVGTGVVALQSSSSDSTQVPARMQDHQPPSSQLPSVKPVKTDSTQALELTPALQAQLGALSAIDEAIRMQAFGSARARLSQFHSSYSDTPFAADLSALEIVLDCATSRTRAQSKARGMLRNPSVRRYWSRIRRACGL